MHRRASACIGVHPHASTSWPPNDVPLLFGDRQRWPSLDLGVDVLSQPQPVPCPSIPKQSPPQSLLFPVTICPSLLGDTPPKTTGLKGHDLPPVLKTVVVSEGGHKEEDLPPELPPLVVSQGLGNGTPKGFPPNLPSVVCETRRGPSLSPPPKEVPRQVKQKNPKGELSLPCPSCGKCFPTRKKLGRHVKQVHKKQHKWPSFHTCSNPRLTLM